MNTDTFKNWVKENTDGFDWGAGIFYENIAGYFLNDTTNLDTKKGLDVRGSVGVGKTAYLKMIQKFLPHGQKFYYTNTETIVSNFNIQGDEYLQKFNKQIDWLIDDLGTEPEGVHYGNRIEVLAKVIELRYNLFVEYGTKTHFTSNLNNDALKEKYGIRAYDRLKEMSNLIIWNTSESKRGVQSFDYKPKEVNKKLTPEEEHELLKKSVQNVWETYKECKCLPIAVGWVYRYLINNGIYKPSAEMIEEAKGEAQLYLRANIRHEEKEVNFASVLRAIEDKKSTKVVNESQRILVKQYFKQLNEAGKELRL